MCEKTPFYNEPVFHMHIDGKVGVHKPNDHAQRQTSRMLFSIVTDALADAAQSEAAQSAREFGTTVYPIWQPRFGFASNHEFHRYMHARYADRGLENSGLPRPHYEIPEVSDSTGPFNPRLDFRDAQGMQSEAGLKSELGVVLMLGRSWCIERRRARCSTTRSAANQPDSTSMSCPG